MQVVTSEAGIQVQAVWHDKSAPLSALGSPTFRGVKSHWDGKVEPLCITH